ncbi:MAG: hypothetical protein RTU30_12065 [Candidatus Thorarchaeota archaeon]
MSPFNAITGILRDLDLVLASGIAFYSFLYATFLISSWARSRIRKGADIRLGWALFLVGLAFNSIFFVISDLYTVTYEDYLFWIRFGYLSIDLSLVGFFFAMERILPYNTRNSITGIGLVIAITTIFFSQEIMRLFAYAIGILAFLMLFFFYQYFRKNVTAETLPGVQLIFIGILIGFIGFILRTDPIYEAFGAVPYTIGPLLLVIGIALFGASILVSPAFDELDWAEQLVGLFVIGEGGILMYHHRFLEVSDVDENLAAAGLSGVQDLLREITSAEGGFNIVSIGEYEILFSHGGHVSSALVSKTSYQILLGKIEDFTEKFELLFQDVIKMQSRSLEKDERASTLVESIFSP